MSNDRRSDTDDKSEKTVTDRRAAMTRLAKYAAILPVTTVLLPKQAKAVPASAP